MPCALLGKTDSDQKAAQTVSYRAFIKMLCSRTLHSSSSIPVDFLWPVRSLWPETEPFFTQLEHGMHRLMEEMKRNMLFMDHVHNLFFERMEREANGAKVLSTTSIPYRIESKQNIYALTLDTGDFTPEELSVKQMGRWLHVGGKQEKKDEGKQGSFYKLQEFTQAFHLPDGIDPDSVTCSFSGGKLHIEAPNRALGIADRTIPITLSPAVKDQHVVNKEEQEESSAGEKD
ncbi:heat shock protein beta-11-like [Polypterus senegalus]